MLPYRILLGLVVAVTILGAHAGRAAATDADGYPQNAFTAQVRAPPAAQVSAGIDWDRLEHPLVVGAASRLGLLTAWNNVLRWSV